VHLERGGAVNLWKLAPSRSHAIPHSSALSQTMWSHTGVTHFQEIWGSCSHVATPSCLMGRELLLGYRAKCGRCKWNGICTPF